MYDVCVILNTGRYGAIIEEMKGTLQQERQEHTLNVEKLQNAKQELEKQSREYGENTD